MKSKSIVASRLPQGMELVVIPRAVTYKAACPNSGTCGESPRRTFPTICKIICRVSRVSCHGRDGNSGQAVSGILLLWSKTGGGKEAALSKGQLKKSRPVKQ